MLGASASSNDGGDSGGWGRLRRTGVLRMPLGKLKES
jgi:hypothetical protein